MNNYTTNTEEYLQNKGVRIIKREGKELVVHCIFNGCDNDSKGSEAHLYFEKNTGLYDCKKCGENGNMTTLKKHFGDFTPLKSSLVKSNRNFTQNLVEECADSMQERIRTHLNGRGVSDEIISKYKVGYGNFYGSNWITIPMKKEDELEYSFFYLRKDPENTNENLPKNLSFPKGKGETLLFGECADESESLIITEGIIDCLSLLSLDHKSVCSTGGCMTFKDSWITDDLLKAKSIYVAYDRDESGEKGAEKVLKLLKESKYKNLYKVTLPEIVGDKGDVNDYICKHKLPVEELMSKCAEPYPKQIDHRQFKELCLSDIEKILSSTIIGDRDSKLITFLCQLSAFTKDGQFNIMFNSPSSTGKSYTALEVSRLFPKESLLKLGNCSATAFFHDTGKYNKETNTVTVDLSNKILIFTENQHYQLLEKLRSFLSHDEKIMNIKITDKGQKGGHKTKNIELIGYASVIFCTATLKSDSQEKTRFIILSPEISDEKISGGIKKVLDKESDNDRYQDDLCKDKDRSSLILRIEAIKNLEVQNIYIDKIDREYLQKEFFASNKNLQPRHQRDIKRVISIIKSVTLLNAWFRDLKDSNLIVNRDDIDAGLSLYSNISMTQNLGISPYLHQLFKEIIRPCYFLNLDQSLDKEAGISYQNILNYHYKIKNTKMDHSYLRQNVIPELEACGLIEKEHAGTKVIIHLTDRVRDFVSDDVGGVKIEN